MLGSPGCVFAPRCCAAPESLPTVRTSADTSRADRRLGRHRRSDMAASRTKEVAVVSLKEWQAWGTSSPLPAMVAEVVEHMKALEKDVDVPMTFGGIGGKLQGTFKIHADGKNRAVYKSLTDSETKLQFFSSRQIACRLLGSRGYLCQKCWLAMEDCICSRVVPCPLWPGIKFWLYMHPKDFCRQNNTGKLLWQVFGIQAASLCLYGIHEHEEIMWDEFRNSGKSKVWFLYPCKNAKPKSLQDMISDVSASSPEGQNMVHFEKLYHLVLIDGTWSNSAAMYARLKDRWLSTWGESDLPCISLSNLGASAMHRLRPQPSWDRTCTAAAAAGILSELHHLHPELGSHGLDKQAEAVENTLDVLLDGLTRRRLRMGRSITRRERKSVSFSQEQN